MPGWGFHMAFFFYREYLLLTLGGCVYMPDEKKSQTVPDFVVVARCVNGEMSVQQKSGR